MFEELAVKKEMAISQMLEDVDKSCLRRMEAIMYRCSALCCEDKRKSMENVQRCLDVCSVPYEDARKVVQNELDYLDDRLINCSNPCDSIPTGRTYEYQGCITKCVDYVIRLIPQSQKKIIKTLNQRVRQA